MSTSEAETALGTLEKLARAGQKPSHYVARHVLLALGEALRSADPAACGPWLARARVAGETLGAPWDEAVRTELSLACGEFAQCLDPRFLALPNYDLEYTQASRERLGDRLRSAQALGFQLAPNETDVLELADRVLATYLQGREEAK